NCPVLARPPYAETRVRGRSSTAPVDGGVRHQWLPPGVPRWLAVVRRLLRRCAARPPVGPAGGPTVRPGLATCGHLAARDLRAGRGRAGGRRVRRLPAA